MKIEVNSVTPLSKVIAFLVFIGVPLITFLLGVNYEMLREDALQREMSMVRKTPQHALAVKSTTTEYRDETIGFTFSYPNALTPTDKFSSFYHLPSTWRVGAVEGDKGVPLVSVPVFRIEQEKAYPRYFDTELRIGVSSSTKGIANCLKPDAGYEDASSTIKTIGGVPFQAFTLQNAGMMQYMDGVSYRAVYGGACIAIEAVRTGSIYRDETMAEGISDDALNGYYNQVLKMIDSFTFTKKATDSEKSISNECMQSGGVWDKERCVLGDKKLCESHGGTFHECESACSDGRKGEVCIQRCIPVCTF